jgi:hypothetical protein
MQLLYVSRNLSNKFAIHSITSNLNETSHVLIVELDFFFALGHKKVKQTFFEVFKFISWVIPRIKVSIQTKILIIGCLFILYFKIVLKRITKKLLENKRTLVSF